MTTCIRNADWIVAWDEAGGTHRYIRNSDLAFTGNVIDYVGPGYTGNCDEEIDGAGLCVMPGLVNIHSHPTNQPITRGVREEMGNPKLYGTSLYNRTFLWATDGEGAMANAEIAYGELLKCGVTSLVDFSGPMPDRWVSLMAESGLRVFAAPSFRDALWRVEDDSRLEYDWDEKAGRAAFDRSVALVDEICAHECGRLSGVIAPAQVDTCSADTLWRSHKLANEKGLMWQTHAAQTLPEFHEMARRHGKTPVQWLDEIGVLGPGSTIAHGIFLDSHPWTNWHTNEDRAILARTGATVAHCPVVFSRYGHVMQSLGGYMRDGVNMGLGTDTTPHNLIEEMRQAATLSRVAAGDMADITTTQVFHAATVGGARALRRDDIGRLAAGAKADFVLLDLANPYMCPVRDPLRSLIHHAADRAVRDVYVDGNKVVEDGEVLTLDMDAALDVLQAKQDEAEAKVPERHPDGLSGRDVSPLVLPE
ncbi:MAG: amidohydrolase family protein [Pseudomonadota bacterium]|nr:amidohydrolase family protein [Pseudomonadota bacterium]